MAMIGRRAAVAEIGEHRHELHGRVAFAAWLGVHAVLLANMGAELKAFIAWAEDFYLRPHHRSAELLDPTNIDTPRIHWRGATNRLAEALRQNATWLAKPPMRRRRPADVFVIFGITGDLAKVMTFHSLYRLEARGLLDCPIVGVAVTTGSVEQLRRPRSRVHRRLRRERRRRGLRTARRAVLLRRRRLQRSGNLSRRRRCHEGRPDAGVLPGDPAVPVRSGDRQAHRGRPDQDRPGRRREAVRPRPRFGPAAVCRAAPVHRRVAAVTGSTTSSARWVSRSCSTSGSRTR